MSAVILFAYVDYIYMYIRCYYILMSVYWLKNLLFYSLSWHMLPSTPSLHPVWHVPLILLQGFPSLQLPQDTAHSNPYVLLLQTFTDTHGFKTCILISHMNAHLCTSKFCIKFDNSWKKYIYIDKYFYGNLKDVKNRKHNKYLKEISNSIRACIKLKFLYMHSELHCYPLHKFI